MELIECKCTYKVVILFVWFGSKIGGKVLCRILCMNRGKIIGKFVSKIGCKCGGKIRCKIGGKIRC